MATLVQDDSTEKGRRTEEWSGPGLATTDDCDAGSLRRGPTSGMSLGVEEINLQVNVSEYMVAV